MAVCRQKRTPEGFSGVGVWLSLVDTGERVMTLMSSRAGFLVACAIPSGLLSVNS